MFIHAAGKHKRSLSQPQTIWSFIKSSLLAAYRASGDRGLLEEAMKSYPTDPKVAFEAVFTEDTSPEQRRQWLNTFEQMAPDNALANYLSARDYFKAGQTDQAVQELTSAAGKHF